VYRESAANRARDHADVPETIEPLYCRLRFFSYWEKTPHWRIRCAAMSFTRIEDGSNPVALAIPDEELTVAKAPEGYWPVGINPRTFRFWDAQILPLSSCCAFCREQHDGGVRGRSRRTKFARRR